MSNRNIVIVGGARDYRAVDWYRVVKRLLKDREISILTDLIDSEGYDIIVDKNDRVDNLFNIDWLLPSTQSRYSDIWRNILKLMVLPIQVFYLKKFAKKNPHVIYHAHAMYYMFLCWLAKVEFIARPQGSEILVRPYRSKLYKKFAIKSLQSAKDVIIDSPKMYDEVLKLSGVKSIIIHNGIDMDELKKYHSPERLFVTSIRGMTPLYRIDNIIDARDRVKSSQNISFIYPYGDEIYKNKCLSMMNINDVNLGRLNKDKMYSLFSKTILAISIPQSDSSPRSVYEAIFLGCSVASTYDPWMDLLPPCMKKRIYIVDLDNKNWFLEAMKFAKMNLEEPYIPSEEALKMFDENISIQYVIDTLYK